MFLYFRFRCSSDSAPDAMLTIPFFNGELRADHLYHQHPSDMLPPNDRVYVITAAVNGTELSLVSETFEISSNSFIIPPLWRRGIYCLSSVRPFETNILVVFFPGITDDCHLAFAVQTWVLVPYRTYWFNTCTKPTFSLPTSFNF